MSAGKRITHNYSVTLKELTVLVGARTMFCFDSALGDSETQNCFRRVCSRLSIWACSVSVKTLHTFKTIYWIISTIYRCKPLNLLMNIHNWEKLADMLWHLIEQNQHRRVVMWQMCMHQQRYLYTQTRKSLNYIGYSNQYKDMLDIYITQEWRHANRDNKPIKDNKANQLTVDSADNKRFSGL